MQFVVAAIPVKQRRAVGACHTITHHGHFHDIAFHDIAFHAFVAGARARSPGVGRGYYY